MSTASSDPAANVALMRRWLTEVYQNGNFDLIDEFVHPDFVDHTPQPGALTDREGVRWLMKWTHTVLSDIKIEVVHCISEGNLIATTKILRGKQIGDIFGKPPTDKAVEMRIMDFLAVVDGKLKDHWNALGPIVDV